MLHLDEFNLAQKYAQSLSKLCNKYYIYIKYILDKGKDMRAVFCDISKSFDRVWHKGLFLKLRSIGCTNYIVNGCLADSK